MKDRIIAVLLVIGIIACAYLYLQSTDFAPEQADLRQQINDTRSAIDSLAIPSLDLQREYDAAQARLTAERLTLPLEANTSDVIDTLLLAGKRHGVTVVPLSTIAWDTVEIDGRTFRFLNLSASLSGPLNPILDLIEEIENGAYQGLVLDGLSVEAGDSAAAYTAGASFKIYARQGAD